MVFQPPAGAPLAGTNTDLKQPLLRYNVDFAVMLQDLALSSDRYGVLHGQIEVMLIAFDQDGKILNIVKKKSSLALEPNVYSATLGVGMQIHEEMDMPLGDVYLRAGVYDSNSGKCGTVGIALPKVAAAQQNTVSR